MTIGAHTKLGRHRAAKYACAVGRAAARDLLRREARGDTGHVTVPARGTPVTLRLGTTDILVWYSVFVRQDYGAPLPFTPRVILDAGAYTGLSSVYFAQQFPEAEVIALEPDAANFALLTKNTAAWPNIIAVNKALWYEAGSVQLVDRARGHWAFSLTPPRAEPDHVSHQVEALTITSVMKLFGIDVIDLLKIDVEGAEKEIFEHCGEWIDSVRAIFAELHDRLRPGCLEAFDAATASFDRLDTGPITQLRIRRPL